MALSASNNTGRAARTDHLLVQADNDHKLQEGQLCLQPSRQQPAPLLLNACTAVQTE